MLGDRLEKEWKKEIEGAKKKEGDSPKKDAKEKSPSLFKAMLRCFGPRYAMLGIFTFFEECILRIYQPLFMGEEDTHITTQVNYTYTIQCILSMYYIVLQCIQGKFSFTSKSNSKILHIFYHGWERSNIIINDTAN